MVRIKRSAKATGEITIASMSDVAFLLIIFFLVTSIFLLKDGLHLALPDTTKPATVVAADEVATIAVRKDGTATLDGKRADMAAIEGLLREKRTEKPALVVLLKLSGELPYGSAVAVIDMVKAAGVTKLSLRME
jgi:biopolymer transport protein ExbD